MNEIEDNSIKSPILVIDDDARQLESLANIFELDGLSPICCQTAAEARKVCQQQRINVAILDLRMPDVNGLELLKELKKINPEIKIIIHTAYASIDSAISAVNEEAFAYIQKLGNVGELVSHVHRAYHIHYVNYSEALEEAIKQRDIDLHRANIVLKKELSARKGKDLAIKEMHFALTNAMPGMSKMDKNGKFIAANKYYLDMLLIQEVDLIGKNWKTIIHPDDCIQAMAAYQQMQEEGKAEFETRILRQDGSEFFQQALLIKINNSQGEFCGHHCFMRDISERKQTEDILNYQASHDLLTGLLNRRAFEHRAEYLLSTIQDSESGHALCYMDLDQFKVINDTCGHTAGDRMLQQISKIMGNLTRKQDTLARLGGDEFGLIMTHCPLDNAQRVAKNLLTAIRDYHFEWEGCLFRVGVSIGLVAITDKTTSLSELLKQADIACYMAKDLGRHRIHVYRSEDVELTRHRGQMHSVGQIYQSLKEDRFVLFAQKVQPVKEVTGKHYEILIRMKSKDGELIEPSEFLPAAERYNIISSVDRWVVDATCKILVEHPDFLEQINFIAINISGQSFADETFLEFVLERIRNSKIDAKKLCFEVTETAAISNLNKARGFMDALRQYGCQFSLDDFGSGLSSYGYLKNLPADYLKIDGIFVRDILVDPVDLAIVRSINEIGHELGMNTVAEFVENTEIMQVLEEIGVDYVQGFGIERPQPLLKLIEEQAHTTEKNAGS